VRLRVSLLTVLILLGAACSFAPKNDLAEPDVDLLEWCWGIKNGYGHVDRFLDQMEDIYDSNPEQAQMARDMWKECWK
jgi:hypothetical protein